MIVTITKENHYIYSSSGIHIAVAILGSMSNLTPEVRADVNGKLVTRHVRSGSKQPSPSLTTAPALSRRAEEIKALERQIRAIVSDSYMTDDIELNFDAQQLVSNLDNLSDLELSRFALHLNQTEETTAAFLGVLEKGDYALLSDMTMLFDSEHHGKQYSDDEWVDYTPGPVDITNNFIADRNGMKQYLESMGVTYTKMDDLDGTIRKSAAEWIAVRYEAEALQMGCIRTRLLPRDPVTETMEPIVEFIDPEFFKAISEDREILSLAKEYGTTDVTRLRLMQSHEKAISGGVL